MDAETETPTPSRRGPVLILLAGTVLMALTALLIWSWADDSSSERAIPDKDVHSFLDPDIFAQEMAEKPKPFVVNVHVPYEGHIEGTDAFIPYDKIVGDPKLPADKNAQILLYCRSGRMSEIAASALRKDGYIDVDELYGGMNAWIDDGKPLLQDAPEGQIS